MFKEAAVRQFVTELWQVKWVELLLEGKQNRIVCMQQHEIVDVDIEEGLAMKKELPQNLVDLAKKLTV